MLRSGALPVNFVQVDRTDVSASLGKDSLQEARNAAVFGLIAVAVFLLIVYRFLGVVAILGLGIYGALLCGAILLFDVVLTLPGFAGLILTVGVAADANIVIFERIKEEVRGGRSVRAAVATGYRKGFSTIVDANVVIMITAFVIFAVAISSVRGFRADAADRHDPLDAHRRCSDARVSSGFCRASAGSTIRGSWARPLPRSRPGSVSISSAGGASGSACPWSRPSSRWSRSPRAV